MEETVLTVTMIMTPRRPLDTAPSERPYKIFSVAPKPKPQAAP